MQTKEIKMLKKGLAIFFFVIALIGLFSSCADKQDEISVNADGYVVVNGVVTEILADKEDVITVDTDGYVIVNGVKTEHKIHTADEITVNADGYVVVNGITTEIVADKADVITVDTDGYVVVNGVKTEHKIHTADEIMVNADGYVVVNGIATEIVADKADVITIDDDWYVVVNGVRTEYKIQEIDFSNLVVNCLGDSLTYGANPNGSQMSKPYPSLLKEELGFSAVNNFGIGGTKIANEGEGSFTVRYAEMPDADIVLVMGGTNDSLSFSLDMIYRTPLGTPNDLSEETFYGALNSLCNKLQNKYKDSFIAFITPLPIATAATEWVYATGSFKIEDACIAIKTVCSRYNIPVFDAYNLTGYGDICNLEKSNGTGDGIHPSQEFWATDFTPKLAQFIRTNYRMPETKPTETTVDFSENIKQNYK